MLIACGFTGTYLSDCIGRKRNFFGNQDKWDVLFISDKEQLSNCFAIYTSKIMEGKSNHTIIQDALHECSSYGYAYYMLKYDSFLNANNSQHHFAVKGDIDIDGPVVVDSTAVIFGNVTAKSLQLNTGAVIQGICNIGTKDVDIASIFGE